MTDLFPDAPVTLDAQIACVEREIEMRRKVYPRWIDKGRMSRARARAELRGMRAVRATLMQLQNEQMGLPPTGSPPTEGE